MKIKIQRNKEMRKEIKYQQKLKKEQIIIEKEILKKKRQIKLK